MFAFIQRPATAATLNRLPARVAFPKRKMSSELPKSPIPIFTTVSAYREWRTRAFEEKKSVGFVATMGALHEGHLGLVRRSLAENDLTVVSIFVNPAQFAPTEDLATYPRTLPHDLKALEATTHEADATVTSSRMTAALFLPSVHEMYPSGITQEVSAQKGTFVEVKGYGHQMEGTSRPTFFRGVATVVTKLFNIIQPTRTYFGQKDIQQALLLRRMVRDLILSHPTPDTFYIIPTTRDPISSLALSSRNAYLSDTERELAAPQLAAALRAAKHSWASGGANKASCIQVATELVSTKAQELATAHGIQMKLDYVEMNDPETFDVVPDDVTREVYLREQVGGVEGERPVILSGAMWVGKTRLIDNIVLGDAKHLGIVETS
ncbi:Pantoate-beta-alanine ligase [Cristinia sonorae]|uniref:Pantoate--beta-alanine ligase n=1 Tax=Cristinia sonorae TaxID=1940300 RepID=A0A8K0UJQ9_9AGAR|nr:Pantoate-beta-alanine ligase [Cristinia sonorae]